MRVFLSHSAETTDLAQEAAKTLREQGLDVWLAEEKILPGDNYAALIAKALESSDAMVVLLSEAPVNSTMSGYEMGYALGDRNYKNKVFPLVVTSKSTFATPPSLIPWIYHPWTRTISPANLDKELRRIAGKLRGPAQRSSASVGA
ncbi:MAG: toll/interleukin-1 receptor domain-containing protein [Opitutales bacterium]|jgi:hypothetical protein